MKQILRKISAAAALVPGIVVGLVASLGIAALVGAAPVQAACEAGNGLGGALDPGCTQGSGQASALTGQDGMVTNIINLMLFIIGILCVIMIIWGGIRYTISNGAGDKVKDAKNTILYAVVGLVIAIIAYALVNWVFQNIGS